MSTTTESRVSKRGIPSVGFVNAGHLGLYFRVFQEDVEAFLKQEGEIGIEEAVKRFEDSYRKYKYVEGNLLTQRAKMNGKIPELRNSLRLLEALEEKKDAGCSFSTTYQLGDQVYGRAEISDPSTVCLWLGANVMLEYALPEARAVLQRNLDAAEHTVAELTEELHFVKDQITTTEVNIAYVFNYGVHQRKMAATAAAGSGASTSK